MPASRKRFPFLPTLATFVIACGATALGVQFYRRPRETTTSLIRAGLLLAGVREGTCDLNGVPMHYYYAGRRGTPLVFVHGLGGSAENWAALLVLLSKEYLVYAPDLPGFGKTPLAPEGVNIRTHVLYLERFLDALGYSSAALVGNSLGGWIAMRFAIDHPGRVKHLYLLNSAGLKREQLNSPYAPDREAAQRSMNRILGYSFPLPGFVLDEVVRTSQQPAYKGFIEGYDAQEELHAVLEEVRVPTTIIWGTQDRLLPVQWAHEFHDSIARSELVLLPGVGHVPQSQAPLKVARIILEGAAQM